MLSPLIQTLIEHLCCLPGVGPKSAQRIALHLLERNQAGGLRLSHTLEHSIRNIKHCTQCHMLSDTELCTICSHPHRDTRLLCVVETPADVIAIEQTSSYRGRYFVLMGHLSPLDGIGPEEIGIDPLMAHIKNTDIQEVILATNTTVEGEATAFYIAEQLKSYPQLHCTRIAHGIPLGGELEYCDGGTLARALSARTTLRKDTREARETLV